MINKEIVDLLYFLLDKYCLSTLNSIEDLIEILEKEKENVYTKSA